MVGSRQFLGSNESCLKNSLSISRLAVNSWGATKAPGEGHCRALPIGRSIMPPSVPLGIAAFGRGPPGGGSNASSSTLLDASFAGVKLRSSCPVHSTVTHSFSISRLAVNSAVASSGCVGLGCRVAGALVAGAGALGVPLSSCWSDRTVARAFAWAAVRSVGCRGAGLVELSLRRLSGPCAGSPTRSCAGLRSLPVTAVSVVGRGGSRAGFGGMAGTVL